jgi:hypothetical protein
MISSFRCVRVCIVSVLSTFVGVLSWWQAVVYVVLHLLSDPNLMRFFSTLVSRLPGGGGVVCVCVFFFVSTMLNY